MGTRADFYVGRGMDAKWLGSIAWDGYPEGIKPKLAEKEKLYLGGTPRHKNGEWEKGSSLFESATEEEFKERLARFFQYRRDVTLPEEGWPWPWKDSKTTDYAYAFDDGTVYASRFGSDWFDPTREYLNEEIKLRQKTAVFPDMTKIQNVSFGENSGLIVVTAGKKIDGLP